VVRHETGSDGYLSGVAVPVMQVDPVLIIGGQRHPGQVREVFRPLDLVMPIEKRWSRGEQPAHFAEGARNRRFVGGLTDADHAVDRLLGEVHRRLAKLPFEAHQWAGFEIVVRQFDQPTLTESRRHNQPK
jgi:hypothetical protein